MRVGWDLGGAHLKLAVADRAGRLLQVRQLPCPLWRGQGRLEDALDRVLPEVEGPGVVHVLTMTGELCDAFKDRAEGVRTLVAVLSARLGAAKLMVYAGPKGYVGAEEAGSQAASIASANWHASAAFVARRCPAGIFVDIGSTTCDLVPFLDGDVYARGYTDAERLGREELVYTGVLRTPIMSVLGRVPLRGEWQPLMAEHFATMGDVYRLTDQLSAIPGDLLDGTETSDGADSDLEDCARRLARMAGHDLAPDGIEEWQGVASFIAWTQLVGLRRALERVSCGAPAECTPFIVGAGIGRFLVARLAQDSSRRYLDFADLVDGPAALRRHAGACAPAVALACMTDP